MNNLESKYLSLYEKRGISDQEINRIENELGVLLPRDMKEILSYYDGYFDVASFSLFSFVQNLGSWNIIDKTKFFRKAISLPKKFVVLKEGDGSIVLLDTFSDQKEPGQQIIWLSSSDVYNLISGNILNDSPIYFPTFSKFFEYLLDEEESIRQELKE